MSFLANLKPFLTGAASVTVVLSAAPEGALQIVVTPKLAKLDADTTDPERAALQAALAHPLRVTLPADADPDAAFAALLTQVHTARAPSLDQFQAYLAALNESANRAKAEAQKKAEASAKKPASTAAATSKKPAPPAPKQKARAKPTAGQSATPTPSAPADDDDAAGAQDHDDATHEDTTSQTEDSTNAPSTAECVSPASPAPQAAASLFD